MTGSRIILALDVPDRKKALEVASAVSPYISYIKINWPLVLAAGADIIRDLGEFRPVICDLKLADIPNTLKLIADEISKRSPFGVIAHAFVGSDCLKELVNHSPEMKVFAVVAMSHPGSRDIMDSQVDRMIDIARSSGVYGVVAPANKPDLLSRVRKMMPDTVIISPGSGAQGGDPVEGIRAGADFLIVGRSLYGAADPAKEAQRLMITTSSR
jgi:orotidine-5'-phosphate decarboxylase